VFVHGNPGPMDDWEELAPQVAEFARVVALDMPGYGRSEHPWEFDFTIPGYGRHLGMVLEALGVRRAHLVLHDFGGAWGLEWASLHLDRVASLSLIDTGVLEHYEWHAFAKIWQTPIVGELFAFLLSPPAFHAAIEVDNPRPIPRSFIDRVTKYADVPQRVGVLRLYRASRDPKAAFGPLADRLRGVDKPTCVIWGTSDVFIGPEYAHRQRDIFPHAEVHVLDGCGHWPFMDDPQRVRDLLIPFLRRVVRVSSR
jgi:pimeloyl-ACP methyl ester carboxylesterase